MTTSITHKHNPFLTHIITLFSSQCFYHKFVEVGPKPRARNNKDSIVEPEKWKKMDSRSLGITRTMIPSSPYTLLKILRTKGFEAYLVGGCVRDLILNRIPKDFDVITTADLHQVKKQFHRCVIIGRRFPICKVSIKGSDIEVSSFKTLAKHSEDKERFLQSQMPKGFDKSDLRLWKNSMHRDFTVNSLFFDPLNFKIYDYNNAMKDLLDLKLRTLVPAHLSFTEDCARILRGLRIAARLGLSFSKDIEAAIHKQAPSLLNLATSRIMMEVDYMLSYGAAESSLRLLQRFRILEILLPFQAAYISRQTTEYGESPMMLMKLLSYLDKIVSCDQPSACRLWIGLLAFHQALIEEPQHPYVVLTFASVLYHQSWEHGLEFARKSGQRIVNFEPETLDPSTFISVNEVARKVDDLAKKVIDSCNMLVDTDGLHQTMLKYPDFPCSGLVFIPKNSAQSAAQLFHVLIQKGKSCDEGRSSFEINHQLLGKGDTSETRFALGKIILNTLGCGIDEGNDNHPASLTPFELNYQQSKSHSPKKPKLNPKSSISNQNAATEIKIEDIEVVVSKQHVEVLDASSCLEMEDCTMEKPEEVSAPQSPTQKSNNVKKQELNTKSSNSIKQNAAAERFEVGM
ncbi:polynucleotide adenylyltransferase family protein [Artemisia annua]|uniref:Polynucleotide adenylyltransferase family protein n=1 Tax=Artemisia annua TaxID=35608 RepID=A0A2U1MRE1_ARTAN|nr:polynucleotide adenylyltransferase family protein [Artemisia annua]